MNGPVDERTGAIDYDAAFMLDAEELAEQGVAAAYAGLSTELSELGIAPAAVSEDVDADAGTYTVQSAGTDYRIYGPSVPASHSWGLATFALFDIVNRQLAGHRLALYAINDGNDLIGIFMTHTQAERARRALSRKSDWPYLPTAEPDWFGMFHD
ncbi:MULTISPECIES: hypothetical protein [unclassified Kribbella]|uniref:hypothetical protein n=1 Tax=unclassified Kribbella TaxID=2644121 RepID=UPI003016E194